MFLISSLGNNDSMIASAVTKNPTSVDETVTNEEVFPIMAIEMDSFETTFSMERITRTTTKTIDKIKTTVNSSVLKVLGISVRKSHHSYLFRYSLCSS